jgi:ferritin-like metal-binding protein YciE
MRKLSEAEVLNLKEVLQMETLAMDKAKAMQSVAKDKHIQELIESGITAGEGRIRGIQQFVSENNILEPGEVH